MGEKGESAPRNDRTCGASQKYSGGSDKTGEQQENGKGLDEKEKKKRLNTPS